MENKLDICIIVPVYNAEDYLVDCLDSICSQTYKNWFCVLVNDGSTDGSQAILESYCTKDPRFSCLIKKNERSASLARRYALRQITSEWVFYLDADDAIEPQFLESLVKRQLATNADMVSGKLVRYSDGFKGGDIVWQLPLPNFDMNQVISGYEACLHTIGGWEIGGVAIVKRDILLRTQPGPYMNSDEYEQRERLLLIDKYAFADVEYYYRANIGTSDKVSVRMFDRTLVDMQLEEFVNKHFPEREDKIKALIWQRYFNLIYLSADYVINKRQFTNDEIKTIDSILKLSYSKINKLKTLYCYPLHALMSLLGYRCFLMMATKYVKYKRNHGGIFWYR